MKNLIILVLSSLLLSGCASYDRMNLAEGDNVVILDVGINRCRVEWFRGYEVARSDGLPPHYHAEFRCDIWIDNSQITDLGVKNISKGDMYALVGGELRFVPKIGSLVPDKMADGFFYTAPTNTFEPGWPPRKDNIRQ